MDVVYRFTQIKELTSAEVAAFLVVAEAIQNLANAANDFNRIVEAAAKEQ